MRKSKRTPAGKAMSIQEREYNNKQKAKELAKEFQNIKPTRFDLK